MKRKAEMPTATPIGAAIEVFGENGRHHEKAIRRIKRLMAPSWRERASHLAGERLTRMGY